MKTELKLFAIILFFITTEVNAQWQKILERNLGNTGKLLMHESTLFHYGTQTFRSTNNGDTWTEITSSFQSPVKNMVNAGTSIVAMVFLQSSNRYAFYFSNDNGVSWAQTPSQITPPANANIINLTYENNELFAVTDRSSFFRSSDKGNTWTEFVVDNVKILGGTDVASSGSRWIYTCTIDGAFVSNESKTSWTQINPDISVSGKLRGVYYNNGYFFGYSNVGLVRMPLNLSGWTKIQSGLPIVLNQPPTIRDIQGRGNSLFISVVLADGNQEVYQSDNNGETWQKLSSALPPGNQVENYNIAVNSSYAFLYHFSAGVVPFGLYRTPVQIAATIKKLEEIPSEFSLKQNYPNPFNPSTKIQFAIPASQRVSLKVFDITGREVANLVDEFLSAGNYLYDFDGSKLSSGIYFYRLISGNFSEIRKMTLIK
jgi:photosystem II stability/assembly factor-like uncharacterized protein